jgi:hypothetical protein
LKQNSNRKVWITATEITILANILHMKYVKSILNSFFYKISLLCWICANSLGTIWISRSLKCLNNMDKKTSNVNTRVKVHFYISFTNIWLQTYSKYSQVFIEKKHPNVLHLIFRIWIFWQFFFLKKNSSTILILQKSGVWNCLLYV